MQWRPQLTWLSLQSKVKGQLPCQLRWELLLQYEIPGYGWHMGLERTAVFSLCLPLLTFSFSLNPYLPPLLSFFTFIPPAPGGASPLSQVEPSPLPQVVPPPCPRLLCGGAIAALDLLTFDGSSKEAEQAGRGIDKVGQQSKTTEPGPSTSSQSLVNIGPGLPALSRRLIDCIRANEFVDFT